MRMILGDNADLLAALGILGQPAAEDLFGFDDYHWRAATAVLLPPLPGVPYLVSEAVGAIDGPPRLRWTDSPASLANQAAQHAQVHDIAQSQPRYAGLIAWAAVDYATLHHDGDRVWTT